MWWAWAALALRLVLICYADWHDANLRVKYTDIDYEVFTRASEHIMRGETPYLLETYRYTPALAWLLTPNVWWFSAFGKLLFVAGDVWVGVMIYKMLIAKGTSSTTAQWSACAWLFNPITAGVSTRGNAEPLLAAMAVGALHAVQQRKPLTAGALIALGAHSKIFPAMYALPILLFMDASYNTPEANNEEDSGGGGGSSIAAQPLARRTRSATRASASSSSTQASAKERGQGQGQGPKPPARFFTTARLQFAGAAAIVFVALTALMYSW